MSGKDIQKRFTAALDAFVARLKQDSQVVAAILAGSMSYDTVWEKSDIDVTIIVKEQTLKRRSACLVEDDVLFNCTVLTRNELKHWIGRAKGGSTEHSFLVRSTLLFTTDPTVEDIYHDLIHVGKRDRDLLLLSHGAALIASLSKTEKWVTVKSDPVYAWVFFTNGIRSLSSIITLLEGQVPMREVIQQAMQAEPGLLAGIYTEMMNAPKTEAGVRGALERVYTYLRKNTRNVFASVLDYLESEAEFRTVREIEDYFKHTGAGVYAVAEVCDWLSELGLVQKDVAEVRLTPKSRSMMVEPAYISEAGLSEVDV